MKLTTPTRYFVKTLFFSGVFATFCSHAQTGVVDLTQLENYANQPIPGYITKDNTLAANPITDMGATLGRVLFYDKRLSRNNTISCASCHRQASAFSDPAIASVGVSGTTGRHSMRLINVRFAEERRMFWDERAASVEDQAIQPILDHIEMGFSGTNGDPGFADLVNKLSAIPEYRVLFTAAFGNPAVNGNRIPWAIAQFVRSIQSFDSKYDAGLQTTNNQNANFPNFSAAENAGKDLFMRPPQQGGANCATCHQPPEFDIDENSRNNGVIGSLGGGTDLANTRAPTLRDMVSTNGLAHSLFMHNGVFGTLNQVVAHYNAIPADNANLDRRLDGRNGPQRLNLSATEQANLVAFLGTLTGTNVYEDPKWSDPFDENGELSLILLPAEGLVMERDTGTTARIRCDVVPNVPYELQVSGDLDTWTSMGSMSSTTGTLDEVIDLSGTPSNGRRFYRFAYEPSE